VALGGLFIFILSSSSDSSSILFFINIKSLSLNPLATSYIFKY